MGDNKYSLVNYNKNSHLMLHSRKLKFMINDTKFTFQAEYPSEFTKFLNSKIRSL